MITEEQYKQILREIGWIDYLWEGRPEGTEKEIVPEAIKAAGQHFFNTHKKWTTRENDD